jgi:hypothetical protein
MNKDSFILHQEHKALFCELTAEEVKDVLMAIFEYEETGKPPDFNSNMAKLAFIPIKQSLDRNREKYDAKCGKNKDNINKRWNKKNTNEYDCIKINTKNTDSDSDSDSDNDKKKKINKKEIFKAPELEDIKNYCSERNSIINPEEFNDFYISKGWKIGNVTMKDWKAAVRNWERRKQAELSAEASKLSSINEFSGLF